MWVQNRKAMQAFHKESYQVLEPLLDSPFEADSQGLTFLGRTWPFEPLSALPPKGRGVIFGLPEPAQLKLLLEGSPQRLLIADSQPERVWALMMAFDYSELLAHPALDVQINSPEKLLLDFQRKLFQFRDLSALEWRESHPASELATRMADVFLLQGFRSWQSTLCQVPSSDVLAQQVSKLYQELLPATEKVYKTYPLSCGSGCSECCHKGVGTLLMLTPGEWLVLWQTLMDWPEKQKSEFASQFAQWARRETALLHTLLSYFESEMDQVHSPEFSVKHLALIESQHDQACFLLDPTTQTCKAYSGRPLTCRLFGAGHFYGNTPYTCELDWEKHEQILLREGPVTQLVKSEEWRQSLRQIHSHYPYKMPLALWLLSHLNAPKGEWLSRPQLEYAQFKQWSDPESIKAHLSAI
ncbi:MAG: YkgJ family cysteine cluster protein [Candidatus Sericytochromatia bacterium]